MIRLIETGDLQQPILNFHVPHSKKLDSDHPYFTKQIIWTLIKRKDTSDYPYAAIEEDEKNGIRYQEISYIIIDIVEGISALQMQEMLDLNDCFDFDYEPAESDNLFFQAEYLYQETKAVARPHSRGVHLLSFTFRNGSWSIDREYERRVVKKYSSGIVKTKKV